MSVPATPRESAAGAPYSLRRRLLLWLLIPLGLISIISLLDSYLNARNTANEAADRVLAGSVLAISERVFINEDGVLEVDIPYVALDMLTSAAQDRVFYRVDGPQGEFITGYRKLPVETAGKSRLQVADGERKVRFANAVYRKDPVRVAVMEAAASSGASSIAYRVSVAETTNAREILTRDILLRSAIRQALLIISAAIIVWFAVTRGLKPLTRLEEAIGRRNPADLRAIHHHVPQEVDGLVRHINDFMGRLGGALDALKHFTGNASHQLRTPLTILRTQLALIARAQTLDEAQKATRIGDEAAAEAEHILSQLLLLARIDEASSKRLERRETDLALLARDVTANHVPAASRAGFDLGYEGPAHLMSRGDRELLSELLKNLIDNAIKHAGKGTDITVAVRKSERPDRSLVQLVVEDDGVGLPAERRQTIVQRFRREKTGANGSGLGLAIASEIAQLFEGSLVVEAGKNGAGLRIVISLPCAEPAHGKPG